MTSPATSESLEQPYDGVEVETFATDNTAQRCSCGWPVKPCSRTQTDCLAFQPRREPTTGGNL